MIKRHFLEFEKPLEEIADKIDALEIVSKDNPDYLLKQSRAHQSCQQFLPVAFQIPKSDA